MSDSLDPQEIIKAAAALDLRRQKQILNQGDTIDRLLDDGSYAPEMERLHVLLAGAQSALEEALEELQQVRDA